MTVEEENQVRVQQKLPTPQVNQYGSLLSSLSELCHSSIPAIPKYYIPRKIRSKTHVSPRIFQAPAPDIFAIKGLQRHQLTVLSKGQGTARSGCVNDSINVRFILLETEDHFDKICGLTQCPVHVLEFLECGDWKWIKTRGSLALIQDFLLDHEQVWSETEFLADTLQQSRPICIIDTPGMGKSFLLSRMAAMVSEQFPSSVVRLIGLRDLVEKLPEDANIAEAITIGEDKSVVESIKAGTCFLFLDGFDEIPRSLEKKAEKLLSWLVNHFHSKLWVTTRPHKGRDLEQILSTLGHSLVPFREEDQEEFLIRYWTAERNKENCGMTRCDYWKELAANCVSFLKVKMNQASESERDIAGIPLQCMMFAKVNLKHALSGHPPKDLNQELHLSLYDMYQAFITNCFERLKEKSVRAEVETAHKLLAVELLHPEVATEIRQLKNLPKSLLEAGILEMQEHPFVLQFVHKTFAQFLVVQFCVELIEGGDAFAKKLVDAILKTKETTVNILNHSESTLKVDYDSFVFVNPVQCYFLNEVFHRKTFTLGDVTLDIPEFQKRFTASLASDFAGIGMTFANLVKCQENSNNQDDLQKLPWSNIWVLAGKSASPKFLKAFHSLKLCRVPLSQLQYETKVSIDALHITPLLVAVTLGRFSVVKTLMDECGFGQLVADPVDPITRYLLHFCVTGSANDSSNIILEKNQIIHFLSNWPHHLEQDLNSKTPILQPNIHMDLIHTLIDVGANVNAVANLYGSVLHRILSRSFDYPSVTPEEFHSLLVKLEGANFRCFEQPHLNHRGCSPLRLAIETLELLPETVEIFRRNGANFNAAVEQLNSDPLLHLAIRSGRSIGLIKTLVTAGASQYKRNCYKETVLHMASTHGHLEAVQHFSQNPRLRDAVDLEKNNALHSALASSVLTEVSVTSNEDIQVTLIKAGVSVTSQNVFDKNPFIAACVDGGGPLTLQVIQLMEARGLNITPSTATKALECLLNHYVNEVFGLSDWDSWLHDVVHHLIKKGGVTRDLNIPAEEKVSSAIRRFQFLGMDQTSSTEVQDKFVAPPEGLLKFLGESEARNLVLLSNNPDLTINRIEETLSSWKVVVLPRHLIETIRDRREVALIRSYGTKDVADDVRVVLKRFKVHKFVFIVNNEDEGEDKSEYDVPTTEESVRWADLTPSFQNRLSQFLSNFFGGITLQLEQLKRMTSSEVTRATQAFQDKTEPVCNTFKIKEKYELQFCPRRTLRQSVFDSYLPDILVFRNVSFEEVQALSKWGQNVRPSGVPRYLQDANYVVLNRDSDFEKICDSFAKAKSVHFIEFNKEKGSFQITKTHGSIRNMSKYLQTSETISETAFFEQDVRNCEQIHLLQLPNGGYQHHLSQALKKAYAQHVLIRLSLSSITAELNFILQNASETEDALLTLLGRDFLQRALLKVVLCKYKFLNCDIQLDIDDKPSKQELFTLPLILRKICEKFSNIRFWITANCDLVNLERWLDVCGCELKAAPDSINDLALTPLKDNLEDKLVLQKYVSNTAKCDPTDINERIAVIERLVATNPGLLNEAVNGKVPLHSDKVHLHLLQLLIRLGANLDVTDINGFTLPHYASSYMIPTEFNDLVTFLADIGKVDFQAVANDGRTVLHQALLCLPTIFQETLEILAKNEIDFNAITKRGNSVLSTAIQGGHDMNVLDNLIRLGANWKVKDNRKRGMLHWAAQAGNLSAISYFLSLGCDVNEVADDKRTPLLCVFLGGVKPNMFETVQALVERGADVNVVNSMGNSALHFAVTFHHSPNLIKTIQYLLDCGADPWLKTERGYTFLHMATSTGGVRADLYHELVSLLVTNKLERLLRVKCDALAIPLHYAVRHIELQEDTLRILVAHSDVNAADRLGNTPLLQAVLSNRSCRLLDSLIHSGADWKVVNGRNANPFHLAAAAGNVGAITFFDGNGIDVNAQDRFGMTPLHFAIQDPGGRTHEVVESLLRVGAEVREGGDSTKKSVMELAEEGVRRGKVEQRTVELLRKCVQTEK